MIKNGNPGFWRGKIVAHLPAGMVKVFMPGVYPDEYEKQPEKLPDAELAAPLFGGGISGNGAFSYPDVGSIVWCFFMNGDVNYPVVFAHTLASDLSRAQYRKIGKEITEPDENGKNSGQAIQHCLRAGRSEIRIYEAGGRITLRVGGERAKDQPPIPNAEIIIDDGKIFIMGGEVNVKAQSDITMQADGNFTLTAGKHLHMAAADATAIFAGDVAIASDGHTTFYTVDNEQKGYAV